MDGFCLPGLCRGPAAAGCACGTAPQDETAEEKARREQDLKVLEEAITANAEARRHLEAEVADIKADRAKLNAALIETAGAGSRHRGSHPGTGAAAPDPRPPAKRPFAAPCRAAVASSSRFLPPSSAWAAVRRRRCWCGRRTCSRRFGLRSCWAPFCRNCGPRPRSWRPTCRACPPQGGDRHGPGDAQRRADGPQPGAGAPGRPHGGPAKPHCRGRAQCRLRAAERPRNSPVRPGLSKN